MPHARELRRQGDVAGHGGQFLACDAARLPGRRRNPVEHHVSGDDWVVTGRLRDDLDGNAGQVDLGAATEEPTLDLALHDEAGADR